MRFLPSRLFGRFQDTEVSAAVVNTAFDTASRTRGPVRRRDDAGPPSVSPVTFPRSHPAPQIGLPRYRTSRFLARSSSQPATGFTFVLFRGSAPFPLPPWSRSPFRLSVMPETPLSSPRGSLWPGAHSGLAPPRHMAYRGRPGIVPPPYGTACPTDGVESGVPVGGGTRRGTRRS